MPEQNATKRSPKFQPLTGKTFGYLTVIEEVGYRGERIMWKCLCACGREHIVCGQVLRRGNSKSCGCMKAEFSRRNAIKHGKYGTREYRIHHSMLKRCYCKSATSYKNYGARGITVCDRWRGEGGFERFLADMGPCPSESHSIERKLVDGNYEPDNCVWIPLSRQARNTRKAIVLTVDGRSQCLAAWAEEMGIAYSTILARLQRGWTAEDAVRIPLSGFHSHRK